MIATVNLRINVADMQTADSIRNQLAQLLGTQTQITLVSSDVSQYDPNATPANSDTQAGRGIRILSLPDNVVFKGTDGKDGQPGKDGTNGKDGATPTINANGNWQIGTTDTGVAARGPKGDKGDAGPNSLATNVTAGLALTLAATRGVKYTAADGKTYWLPAYPAT